MPHAGKKNKKMGTYFSWFRAIYTQSPNKSRPDDLSQVSRITLEADLVNPVMPLP